MTNFQVEEQARNKRQLTEQAINLAKQNKWEEAIRVNQQLLERYPGNVDALNRLGRALNELGRYREARDAYNQAVAIDPLNSIAQKNLARLSTLTVETATPPAPDRVDPQFFIAEMGKTGVATLAKRAAHDLLAQMVVGDRVSLQPEGRALYVKNDRGEVLGQVEPRLSQRLIDLMKGGNQYAAAIMSVQDGNVKVFIREVYQDPRQAGKVSFPTKGDVAAIRPYIKDTLLKYGSEEDEEEEEVTEEGEFGADGEEVEEPVETTEFEDERASE